MRLASTADRIHGAGAEIAAVSVNEDFRQAGMSQRWGLGPIKLVSDPGGETYLKQLDLFDPAERGGIALPGMVIIDPDGNEVYRYQGRDFADRTNDDDIFAALDTLGLPAVSPAPWVPGVEVPSDLRGYFRAEDFAVYFRGNMFGAIAIGGRIADPESKALAREHQQMCKASLDAFEALAAAKG